MLKKLKEELESKQKLSLKEKLLSNDFEKGLFFETIGQALDGTTDIGKDFIIA